MRSIQVSADVFQAIWAARKAGEDDENAILGRVLGVEAPSADNLNRKGAGGPWRDARYGVVFPQGFELFRTYLGREYKARVDNGEWVLNGEVVKAPTLNVLSARIGATSENAWMNWNFRDAEGTVRKATDLRRPDQIVRRPPRKFRKEFLDRLD